MNSHAKVVPDFIPNMGTPAFPTYTSGHSTFSAAGSRMLELFFGTDDIEFTATSDGLPGAIRSYKKLSDCRNEIGMSRIWAGIHFMVDNIEAVIQAVLAHGGVIVQPPGVDAPEMTARFRDPGGNCVFRTIVNAHSGRW